jgi:hypothetical protein
VSNADQLEWEARMGRPAAAAAFVAGLLLLVGTLLFNSILDDRRRVEALPDFLLSVNDSPGTLIGAGAIQGLASLLLIAVFLYLFRATIHRTPTMPRWFVYLIVLGPLMYALSQVIGAVDRVDVAESFADGTYEFPDADPGSNLADCPAIRGAVGDDCAQELLRDNANGLSIGLSLAGSVGVAFLFVMLPLRARRAGLLSPFMSILGVIAGALLVLQLLPLVPVIVQAFWLGAIGALFLGNWPGGRGPAWESGEADPWPSPAARRGLAAPADGGGDEAEAADEPAGGEAPAAEPVPERPASRKRRRKRR